MKNSPTPWEFINEEIAGPIILSRGLIIAKMRMVDGISHELNGERIVECVNAFEGIEYPAEFMQAVRGRGKAAFWYEQLKTQRKELLDEIAILRARLGEGVPNPDDYKHYTGMK